MRVLLLLLPELLLNLLLLSLLLLNLLLLNLLVLDSSLRRHTLLHDIPTGGPRHPCLTICSVIYTRCLIALLTLYSRDLYWRTPRRNQQRESCQ